MAAIALHAQAAAKVCTKAQAVTPATAKGNDVNNDIDDIEFSAAPALWICFAVALLIGLVVTH